MVHSVVFAAILFLWMTCLVVIRGHEHCVFEMTDSLLQSKGEVPYIRDLTVDTHETESNWVAFNFSEQEAICSVHESFLKLYQSWLDL
jgi:formate/nitrite transporter FocA (FNT family)